MYNTKNSLYGFNVGNTRRLALIACTQYHVCQVSAWRESLVALQEVFDNILRQASVQFSYC